MNLKDLTEDFGDKYTEIDERARAFSMTPLGRFIWLTMMFFIMSFPGFFAGAIAVSRTLKPAIQECQIDLQRERLPAVSPTSQPGS